MSNNAVAFIESVKLPTIEHQMFIEAPELNLDKLPQGVVSGNTLIDYSAAPLEVRGGLSLAMTFANQAARAEMKPGDDDDDFFAAYMTNLAKLGFNVSQAAHTKSTFKKRDILVHRAIIPFLTIALGGATVGPVILALLENLQEINKDQPWITLYDRETRQFNTRELNFAAVSSDAVECRIRHVSARLKVVDDKINILFFKIDDSSAEFESATTTISVNNALLGVLEKPLLDRLAATAFENIMAAGN